MPVVLLALDRMRFEREYNTVGLVIDYADLRVQAREWGLDERELVQRYRAAGIGGVAVTEASLARFVERGKVLYRVGSDWINERLSVGKSIKGIEANKYYLRSLEPGVAERFVARYLYRTSKVEIDGANWFALPVDAIGLGAGPDAELMQSLRSEGLFIAYRPFNSLSERDPGSDFPAVPYLIHYGDEVVGYGDEAKLERVVERSGKFITGFIESSDQKGIDAIVRRDPIVRVFSIPADWQALLKPEEVASKFVLAARERNHRLLYVRPFYRVEDTILFLTRVQEGLAKANLKLGQPGPFEYEPNNTLRLLASLGPLFALALLVTTFPWLRLGGLVAVGCLGVSVFFAGFGFAAPALLGAIVFPALGFALYRAKLWDWLVASALTLVGALFVAAIGADRAGLLAIEPFRGVAATLVLPPLIVGAAMVPRQDLRKTISDLWNTPVSLGTFGLALIALAAVALVVLRRGNTSAVGVSDLEAKVRNQLQDSIIRPRTKEIALHPAALVGLGRSFPLWMTNVLILAGVIGQGSIIDSFAHYHTPLLISLLRTFNGLAFGLVLGIIALFIVRLGVWVFSYRSVKGVQGV